MYLGTCVLTALQLLNSQGLEISSLRHTLPNLLRLLNAGKGKRMPSAKHKSRAGDGRQTGRATYIESG